MELKYLRKDCRGYEYNGIYPPAGAPDSNCWQKPYSGYKNEGEEAVFHCFAVQGYNLEFKFKEHSFTLLGWMDGDRIALLDKNAEELQRFLDPIDAIQHCQISGYKLLDILSDITDIECG